MKSTPGLRGRRHIRQARQPLGRRDGIGLDGAGLDLRNDVERLVDHVVDLAADEILERRPGAAIRHQAGLKPNFALNTQARHMGDRADAGMAVAQLRCWLSGSR